MKYIGSVGAGRSPRRQMRRYFPCGERFVMSLATVAKTKTSRFRGKNREKNDCITIVFSDINMTLFDFSNSQSILLASFNFADL